MVSYVKDKNDALHKVESKVVKVSFLYFRCLPYYIIDSLVMVQTI